MAKKGYYEQLYHNLFKGSNKITNSVPKTNEEKVQSQIDNAKTKITKAGIDAGEVTDNRNPLEKLLNLTPNQNFLFDVFELLNRPQQAMFGGIENAQNGKDFWQGVGEGFTGKKETQFKKILQNANIGGEDRKGKIDLVDVLGFVGDVMLDPMDLAIIPVKGAKVADAVGDIAKVDKGLSLVQDASKGAKTLDNATDLVKAIDSVKDVSDVANKATEMKSLSSLIFEGIGKGIKETAKVADKGIEGTLKMLDNAGVRNSAGEIAKITYNNPLAKDASKLGKVVDNIADITKEVPIGKLETYKELKDWFSRAFNNAKNMPKRAIESLRKSDADGVRAAIELKAVRQTLDDNLLDAAKKIATQTGDDSIENINKIAKQLDGEVLHLKEFLDSENRFGKVGDLIKMADDGALKATDDIIKKLDDLASDINMADRGLRLTTSIDEMGNVVLSKDWSKVGKRAYEGLAFDPMKIAEDIKLPTNYRPEQIEQLNKLAIKYAEDPIYKELYSKVDPIFNKANEILDKNFGTNLATKYADNAGYVRHAYDRETFDNYRKMGLINSDGSFKLKGNSKVLGDRKYKMSVMETNNMFEDLIKKNYDTLDDVSKKYIDEHSTLFKDLYTSSFDDYLMNVPKVAKDNNVINEIFIKQTFTDWKDSEKTRKALKQAQKAGDTNLIEKLTKQYANELDNVNMKMLTKSDPTVPSGFRVLSVDESKDLANKMNKIADELGIDNMRNLANTVKSGAGKMAINNDIVRLIGVNTDNKTPNALLRLYDRFLNFFKRNKVLSPTFQMNNLIGNASNMALGGISPTKQAMLFPKAAEIMGNAETLMKKAADGLELTTKEKGMLDIWNKFMDAGFANADLALNLRDMPDSLKVYFTGQKQFKNVKDILLDGLPYLNNKMNNYMDTMARLATFIEASSNTKLLSSLNVGNAGEAVRKILFDPSDLTEFERNVMKRIIPFYTFTKKNLAYHIQNLGENGQRYHRLIKGIQGLGNMATDGEYKNIADFLKNNLYIPIPGLGKNGEYKVLRTTLPFGQVLDMASNPLNNIVSMIGPAFRSPIEMVTNKQAFNGSDIEKFAGEKSKNIPYLTKKQEYLLSQLTGLDVPLKQASRIAAGNNLGQGLLNTVTMDKNINTDRLYKLYDELEKLETIMSQYKQTGVEFSTMNELKKANKNVQVNSLMAKLNKLNGIKRNPYQ